MTQKIIYLSIILTLIVSANSFAQNPQELRVNSFINGDLGADQEIWYSVRVTDAGILTVETTGSTDTYLEAYDAQRNLLKEDDDSGEGHNAKIEIIAVRGSTYLFKLRGYSSDISGPFRILASQRALPPATQLRSGAQVSGNINTGSDNWYSFNAFAAGILVVETSGDIDTYMEAYNDVYTLIDENDDGGESLNARIEIALTPAKMYYFKVRGYNSDVSGPFRISANFTAYPPDERNTERARAFPVRLGEVLYVYLRAPSESRWYVYQTTSAVNFVTQTKGNIDTLMNLYDSAGVLLAEDDDSGEDLNALIRHRLNAGTYYIEVKGYSEAMGRCTLHTEIWP